MPIFDFECPVCGHQEEIFVFPNKPYSTLCPKCNKPMLKQVSAFARTAEGWR